jgi:hypothetical protein
MAGRDFASRLGFCATVEMVEVARITSVHHIRRLRRCVIITTPCPAYAIDDKAAEIHAGASILRNIWREDQENQKESQRLSPALDRSGLEASFYSGPFIRLRNNSVIAMWLPPGGRLGSVT